MLPTISSLKGRQKYISGFNTASFLILLVSVLLSSCSVYNKSQVFRNKEHEDFYKTEYKKGKTFIKLKDENESTAKPYRYTIRPGDEIRVRFLNMPKEIQGGQDGVRVDEKYLVNIDGYLIPPLIEKIHVQGKTVDELQKRLVQEYANLYLNPTIDVSVVNMKIFVYGDISKQGVVTLPSERTHLIEAISLAGGLNKSAKVSKIKIIRGNLKDPQIYWVDLRDVSLLGREELLMRSGDAVYIEPRAIYLINQEIMPYLSMTNLILTLGSIIAILRGTGVFTKKN